MEVVIDKFDFIWSLLALGFTIGIVVFVVGAAAKIGWKFAPYAIAIAAIAWIFF